MILLHARCSSDIHCIITNRQYRHAESKLRRQYLTDHQRSGISGIGQVRIIAEQMLTQPILDQEPDDRTVRDPSRPVPVQPR